MFRSENNCGLHFKTEMNYLQHKFHKYSEEGLLHFLKVAKGQEHNCDLMKYEVWKHLIPLSNDLKNLIQHDNTEVSAIIDLNSSNEDLEHQTVQINSSQREASPTTCTLSSKDNIINEAAHVIHENLETYNDLCEMKEKLEGYNSDQLKILFKILSLDLNTEQVYLFGNSIQESMSLVLITEFIRHLLVQKIKHQYCLKLSKLMVQLSQRHPQILQIEVVNVLKEANENENVTILKYLIQMNLSFQCALLRDLICTTTKLRIIDIKLIDLLLNDKIGYDALTKLVEVLCNSADEYETDRNFGKLVIHTVEVLGPQLPSLKEPLKHISNNHKSIWKPTLEKMFRGSIDDSMLFSQSFR